MWERMHDCICLFSCSEQECGHWKYASLINSHSQSPTLKSVLVHCFPHNAGSNTGTHYPDRQIMTLSWKKGLLYMCVCVCVRERERPGKISQSFLVINPNEQRWSHQVWVRHNGNWWQYKQACASNYWKHTGHLFTLPTSWNWAKINLWHSIPARWSCLRSEWSMSTHGLIIHGSRVQPR